MDRHSEQNGAYGWTDMDVSLEVDGENAKGRFYLHRPQPPSEDEASRITPSDELSSRTIASSVSSDFNIELIYSGNPSYQWAFDRAVERWEDVITADLPGGYFEGSWPVYNFQTGELLDTITNETIDDLRIYAAVEYIDGPYGTLGAAGPEYVRGWDYDASLPLSGPDGLPVVGVMVFDSADLGFMMADGLLETVVTHEMGHVLGSLDLYWQANGYQGDDTGQGNPSSDYYQYAPTNVHVDGTQTSQAYLQYQSLGGSAPYIAIEADGGGGTAGSHWDEAIFRSEIMTGYANGGASGDQLSVMTLGMLDDIGYTVDYARSDAYQLSASSVAPVIVSDGGGASAQIGILDGYSTVTSVQAVDGDLGDRVTYQIYNGPDQGQFRIDPISGLLELVEPADANNLSDANGDGIWNVTVRATDGYRYDLQSIEVALSGEIETIGDIGLYRVPGSYGIYDFRTNDEFVLTDSRGRYIDNSRYNFLHAEEDQRFGYEGYWVLQESRGRYSIRHFDETGKEDAKPVRFKRPDDVIPFEPLFEADVNNDDWIGLRLTPVEDDQGVNGPAFGNTQLHKTQSGGYAVTDESYDTSLDYDPSNANAGVIPTPLHNKAMQSFSTSRYAFTHAEADTDGGYWVLDETRGKYTVRHFNDDGQEDARPLTLRRPDVELPDWEETFDANLNGDLIIGHGYAPVESVGDVVLSLATTGGYTINHSGGGEVDLRDKRGKLIPQSSKYQFEHAEENATGGYDVLVNTPKRGIANYSVRHFDSTGQETSHKPTQVGSLPGALADWEVRFEFDLNNDTRLGPGYYGVEDSDDVTPGKQAYGDHQLHTKSSGGYAISTAGFDQDADPQTETPIDLTDWRGTAIDASRYTLTQVEAKPNGGYWVLDETRGRYSVREFDELGQQPRTSKPIQLKTVADLVAWEGTFAADLDGDGTKGPVLTPVEDDQSDTGPAFGETQLHRTHVGGYAVTTEGYDVSLEVDPANNGGETPVSLSAKRGVISAAKANFIHAEADTGPDGGYWALEYTRGRYTVRHFNEEGKEDQRPVKLRRPDQELSDWEDEFLADLTGEGTVGNDAPVFQTPTPVSLAEDRAISATPVATVVATSTNGIAGYEITSGNVGDAFAIDGGGNITQIAGLDFETTDAYALTIQATDTLGNTVSTTLDLTITDQNDAPEFTGGETAAVDFAENSEAVVYTAQATDEDASADVITYALGSGGGDEGLFNIDPSSGELTFKTPPDFEDAQDVGGDNVYEVQIEASDANGGTATQTASISVTNSLVSAVKIYPGYTTQTQQNLGTGIFGKDGIASGSDYDNDGIMDLLIGVPWHDRTGIEKAGHAWIIHGDSITSDDPDEIYSTNIAEMALGTDFKKIVGAQSWDQLGSDVTFIADISGDNLPEIAVGVPYEKIGGANTAHVGGSTYIYFSDVLNGAATWWSTSGWSNNSASVKIAGISELDNSGHQIKGSINLDGDSADEIVISAPRGNSETGQVYILFGDAVNDERGSGSALELASLTSDQGITINGEDVGSYLGWAIETAGDFDGDNINDLAIGAPKAAGADGKVYVLFGSYLQTVSTNVELSTLTASQGLTISGSITDGEAGKSLTSLGDIDGDGKDELVVGAPYSEGSAGAANEGHTFVVFGSAIGEKSETDMSLSQLNGSNGIYLEGRDADDLSGWTVANVADLNGDGRDDLAIGAPDAEASDGEAYIIWSSTLTDQNFLSGAKLDLADSVFNAGGGALIVGSDNSGQFGYKIASAGDFDGDGSNDFFVSSPADHYTFDDGSGYLLSETILGSANSGILQIDDLVF